MMGRLRRLGLALAVMMFAAAGLVAALTNPNPWTETEVRALVAGLNEAAAIGVPHGFLMEPPVRRSHLTLLAKVEKGIVLDEAESADYRSLFQSVLADNQRLLGFFDAELTILADHAMHQPNNKAGHGISGRHDHHDQSARLNFAGLLASLNDLTNSRTPLGRIASADRAYKDLVDLISHMGVAPHTVSVGYVPPEQPWPDKELGEFFEAMLKGFKQAQFAAVNSPAYWAAVDSALENYARLILAVQARVMAGTSPWERRFSGRFLSVQTMPPPVDLHGPLRR